MVQNLIDGAGFVLWRGPKNGEVRLQFFFRPLRRETRNLVRGNFHAKVAEQGTAKRLLVVAFIN